MLKKRGTVWKSSNKGGHVIYVPSDIIKDSQYPFKRKEKVNVELDPVNERLIISKVKKK